MKQKTTLVQAKEGEIYIDGCGVRPDGKGSGFAWIQPRTGKSALDWKDGLTNNQAEYHALLSALTALSLRNEVVIFSDSQILVEQFNGRYAVREPALAQLLGEIRTLIKRNSLAVTVKWVPRAANLADKLLRKKEAASSALSANGATAPQRKR